MKRSRLSVLFCCVIPDFSSSQRRIFFIEGRQAIFLPHVVFCLCFSANTSFYSSIDRFFLYFRGETSTKEFLSSLLLLFFLFSQHSIFFPFLLSTRVGFCVCLCEREKKVYSDMISRNRVRVGVGTSAPYCIATRDSV